MPQLLPDVDLAPEPLQHLHLVARVLAQHLDGDLSTYQHLDSVGRSAVTDPNGTARTSPLGAVNVGQPAKLGRPQCHMQLIREITICDSM